MRHNAASRRHPGDAPTKYLPSIAAALALTVFSIGLIAGAPLARPSGSPDACPPAGGEISAPALEGADHPERCDFGSRPVVDGPAAAHLPPAGEGVYVEVLTAQGAHELGLFHFENGEVGLDLADDGRVVGSPLAASRTRECFNPSYESSGWWVQGKMRYRINTRTLPRELSPASATRAIRRAGRNIFDTRNTCGLGDRVPAGLSHQGRTSRLPDRSDGSCTRSDGVSVVAFGELPAALAVTCTFYDLGPGLYRVTSSDIKIDKTRFRWTTSPRALSCKDRYDLQSVITHEWGHTFGLGHVPEEGNPNMTMSPVINGTCQRSERTLGRGDVLGLDGKYP